MWGRSSCTPTFRLAVDRLCDTGVWLHYPPLRVHFAATRIGEDLPVIVTLMRALDTVISARLGGVEVVLRG